MSLPLEINLDMMREKLYAAVVSDALDALGYRKQSPKIEKVALFFLVSNFFFKKFRV